MEEGRVLLSIQPDGPVPIYEQIVAQLIYAVASGSLEAGALIPSVRELAEQLVVHPNTVARAFQELEREGVVTPRRGRGMAVTPEAPAACRAKRQGLVRQHIRLAMREAAGSSLSPDEIRRIVEEELDASVASQNGKKQEPGTS